MNMFVFLSASASHRLHEKDHVFIRFVMTQLLLTHLELSISGKLFELKHYYIDA